MPEPFFPDSAAVSEGAETDQHWMRHALRLARQAAAAGEVPVGGIVQVKPGRSWTTGASGMVPMVAATRNQRPSAVWPRSVYRPDSGAVLFDVYRPKPLRAGEEAAVGALAQGEKSLAVRLTLGSDVATLTEAEIEAAVQAVVEQLAARTGAKLRA